MQTKSHRFNHHKIVQCHHAATPTCDAWHSAHACILPVVPTTPCIRCGCELPRGGRLHLATVAASGVAGLAIVVGRGAAAIDGLVAAIDGLVEPAVLRFVARWKHPVSINRGTAAQKKTVHPKAVAKAEWMRRHWSHPHCFPAVQ